MPELKNRPKHRYKKKNNTYSQIVCTAIFRIRAFRSTEITKQCCESGSNRIRTFFPDPELFVLDPDPAKITD